MSSPRIGRYTGLLGVVVLVGLILHSVLGGATTDPRGIAPGHRLAPFAVPLALGSEGGDADIALHADEGENGKVPACAERGSQILNVCQLYEQGPVVLALFVDSGSCTATLSRMQRLASAFPTVRFAAVAIRAGRGQLRALIRSRGLTLPIGIDSDGAVAALYKVLTCPQVNFALRGGVVQGEALLGNQSLASLRARIRELVAASRAQGGGGAGA